MQTDQRPIETSMVSYYAQRAAEYERIYRKPERQEDLARLREILGKSFAGKDVFEIACGTGFWTEVISSTAESVLATDINEEVLAVARSKRYCGNGKVAFHRLDIYELPEFPRRFSAGLAAFWWSHIPMNKRRAFISSFNRAFEPGARILIADNRFVAGSSTPISRTDASGNTYQTRKLDDGSTHEVLKNFPTEQDLRDAFKGLGGDLEFIWLKYFWVLTYKPIIT